MITVNTKIFFDLLIKAIQPKTLLDIGSMDGSDAMKLKKLSPESNCFAFEANPYNYNTMIQDDCLKKSKINIINKAISDVDGKVSFYVAKQDADQNDWRKGTSSLLKRGSKENNIEEDLIEVEASTLNSFIGQNQFDQCALWIDVEGAAYQVISGANLIADKIIVGHIEVEETPVWAEQKDANAVKKLLHDYGFLCIARGRGRNQHDLVFIRKELSENKFVKIILYASLILTIIKKYFGKIMARPFIYMFFVMTPRGCIKF